MTVVGTADWDEGGSALLPLPHLTGACSPSLPTKPRHSPPSWPGEDPATYPESSEMGPRVKPGDDGA